MHIVIEDREVEGLREGSVIYKTAILPFIIDEDNNNEVIFSATSMKYLGQDIDNVKKEILKRLYDRRS